jgi:hypothetical protein
MAVTKFKCDDNEILTGTMSSRRCMESQTSILYD